MRDLIPASVRRKLGDRIRKTAATVSSEMAMLAHRVDPEWINERLAAQYATAHAQACIQREWQIRAQRATWN